jgi:hypothetical protein
LHVSNLELVMNRFRHPKQTDRSKEQSPLMPTPPVLMPQEKRMKPPQIQTQMRS